jgi:hypothetical protein
LVPKDKKFFHFSKRLQVIELASLLHEAVNLPLKEREGQNRQFRTKGEDITRQTNLELRNFITLIEKIFTL